MNYLALDIGNVLCNVKQEEFVHLVSEKMNLSTDQVVRSMNRFWELHDVGFTNIRDELIDTFGVKSEIILRDLLDAWDRVISPNYEAINAISKLIDDKNLRVALLSNMGVEHMKSMEYCLLPIYNTAIKHFSCEVGARKPSKLFFQSFLMEHPEFKGCIYVDDIRANLDAATKMGFVPFYFNLRDGNSNKLTELREKFPNA
jgi:FMN phosphatase YigB (HAD superfamily)